MNTPNKEVIGSRLIKGKFNDELGSQMVMIFVRAKQERFWVHRNLICAKSLYFEKVLRDSKEIYPGVIRYEMTLDLETFSSVIEWLYKGSLEPPTLGLSMSSARAFKISRINLHILAEELEMKELANMAMEHLGSYYSLVKGLPSKDHMEVVFGRTKVGSPLHRYMCNAIHYYLVRLPHLTMEGQGVITTAQLWQLVRNHEDLGRAIFRRLRSGQPPPQDPSLAFICEYHDHSPNYLCEARRKRFSDYKALTLTKAILSVSPSLKSLSPQNLFVFATPTTQQAQDGVGGDKNLGGPSTPVNRGSLVVKNTPDTTISKFNTLNTNDGPRKDFYRPPGDPRLGSAKHPRPSIEHSPRDNPLNKKIRHQISSFR